MPYVVGELVLGVGAQQAAEPSAAVRDGVVDLYFEVKTSSAIAVARSDASGLRFGPAEAISLAVPAVAPSVVWADRAAHLVFAAPNGTTCFHATSTDGRRFALDETPLFEDSEGIAAPSLAITAGTFELVYATRAGAIAYASRPPNTAEWTRIATLLAPGTGCTAANGRPADCWDGESVGSPELRVSTTAAGRRLRRLMYVGRGPSGSGIGFAAWFEDPQSIERSPYNPIADDINADEAGPSNILLGDRYLLYFTDEDGLAVRVSDKGEPSETF